MGPIWVFVTNQRHLFLKDHPMPHRPLTRNFLTALAVTTALSAIAPPAFAQIEEIVVTTRKRAENLQEVPIVVTAFTAASIVSEGKEIMDCLLFLYP